jgi:hypothetical protein
MSGSTCTDDFAGPNVHLSCTVHIMSTDALASARKYAVAKCPCIYRPRIFFLRIFHPLDDMSHGQCVPGNSQGGGGRTDTSSVGQMYLLRDDGQRFSQKRMGFWEKKALFSQTRCRDPS